MAYTELALFCDSVAYAAVAAWSSTHAYSVGNIVRQLAAPTAGNERCFICITAGTSLSSEPTWVVTKGAKTAETGGPVWMECTALPAVNGDGVNTNAWHASAGSIALGVIIKNVAANHYFICTTAGTGGTGSEPSWNTATGGTTTDSTVTWTCIGTSFSRWAAAAKMLQNPVWNLSSWLVNANMTVFVGDDHGEVIASATNWTPAFACQVLCVDHTAVFPLGASALRTTASLQTPGSFTVFWNSAVNGYVYGLQILTGVALANNGIYIGGGASPAHVVFENCLFTISITNAGVRIILGDNGNNGGICEFKGCTFNITAASQSISIVGATRLENCSLTGAFGGSGNQIFSGQGTFTSFVAEGCDFSTNVASGVNLAGSNATQPFGYMLFKDCLIRSDYTSIFRGGDASMGNLVIELNRCDSGGTSYRNERHSAYGTELTSASVARTSGAVDGSQAISHQITTTANTLNNSNISNQIPLVTWNATTGANRNVTIYGVANDSRVPNNDELWLDCEFLGDGGSPKGSYVRGFKANMLASGSPLTADTSAWDGAATARVNSTAYTVGNIVKVASNPGRIFFCTSAGTSAASEPTAIAASATTWNPSDKSSNISLSGGNLTATMTFAANGGCRSTVGQATGKFYFEGTITNGVNGVFGIISATTALTTINNGATAVIAYSNGIVWVNNNNIATLGAFSLGQTACVAVDFVNQMIWFRINNGNWNNSATANPATNVGGFSIASMLSGAAVYAYFSGSNISPQPFVTANFGGSAFAYTPPSGFSAGPAQAGYATMNDGDGIADGTAIFRAGCRFSQTLTLSSPQPQQTGFLYAMPKTGRASAAYWLDPLLVLS